MPDVAHIAVRERPIIFDAESVRAILDGSKSQTRRVVKRTDAGRVKAPGTARNWHLDDPDAVKACPYGVPGERLWVRETWGAVSPDEHVRPLRECAIEYRADSGASHPGGWDNAPDDAEALRWRSPIHMPRWASRLTLEITEVRVRRIQEITDEEAIAEGVDDWAPLDGARLTELARDVPRAQFHMRWDFLNARRGYSWDSNPWVWAITFTRLPHA